MALYECECEKCGHINDINDSHCNVCGIQLSGTINTRRASINSEILALDKRYSNAIANLNLNDLIDETHELITEINNNGKAVINTPIDFLWDWLIKGHTAYLSYRRQIIDNSRPKAKFENDVKRTLHDSILFGSSDIVYSALTTDNYGLISYGEATLILKTPSIQNRTSALETNSYFFIEQAAKKGWTFDQPLPTGYMSTWFTKDKLCVAKLEKRLKKGLNKREISRLILTSHGDRSTDEFVELHIFGKIVESAIDIIRIPMSIKTSSNPLRRIRLNELEKKFIVEYY